MIDTSGTAQERYSYDPYGAVTFWTGTWGSGGSSSSYGNIHLYQGGLYDGVTRTIEFQHRVLSTQLGTWIQQDPSGYPDGMNQHEFVTDNPIVELDSSGLKSILDVLKEHAVEAGINASFSVPVLVLGIGTIWLTVSGELGIENCRKCNGQGGRQLAFDVGVEIYWSANAVEVAPRDKPVPWETMTNSYKQPHNGFRDRDAFFDLSTDELPPCGTKLSGSVEIFARFSGGAYWGVQGSATYEAWKLGEDFVMLSPDRIKAKLHSATGVYGLSLEVGGGGHFTGTRAL